MRLSIKAKLTLYNTLIIGALFLVLSFSVYYALKGLLLNYIREGIENSADAVVQALENGGKPGDRAILRRASSGVSIRIKDKDGMVLLSSDPEDLNDGKVVKEGEQVGSDRNDEERHPYLVSRKANISGKAYTVEAFKSADEAMDTLRMLRTTLIAAGVILLAVSVIGAFAMASAALRPIDNLGRGLKSITSSSLDRRLPVKNEGDEIGRLTVILNDLLNRLSASFERQKRFVEDAAHELSTPISGIRGHLGILKSWGKEDPAVREEAIERIDRESKRMADLVNNLLYLASCEDDRLRKDAVHLRKLVEDHVRSRPPSDREIMVEGSSQIAVAADVQMIERAISNLIDNAIKYTGEGGRITVSIKDGGRSAIVEVADDGIGISPEDLPHVFDRFYRSDKARSRATGGTGLGLSIVKSIVEAHGGKVEAESTPNERTTFRIYLPLA